MSQASNSNEVQEDFINVEMAESMSKLEESLECPVCYKIPRNVPISCCEAGHIICQSCRSRVTTCPTCRGSLDSNMTSSLAGNQIMLVNHKCKFSFYGCNIKMKLEQIVVHEKTCLERTVTCPDVECNEEVQLRKFNEHAAKERCAIKMSRSGLFKVKALFNQNEDHSYHIMHSFKVDNLTFYLLSSYLPSKKCFIFSVMLPDDVETASMYNARITVIHSPDSQRKVTFEGSVLSIEDLPDIEDDEANMKYWFVSYETLKPFFTQDSRSFLLQMEVLA